MLDGRKKLKRTRLPERDALTQTIFPWVISTGRKHERLKEWDHFKQIETLRETSYISLIEFTNMKRLHESMKR